MHICVIISGSMIQFLPTKALDSVVVTLIDSLFPVTADAKLWLRSKGSMKCKVHVVS